MRGTIILRLVDITLLLLLSLMATASFTTTNTDLPVTHELSEKGVLVQPLQIELTSDGRILSQDQSELTFNDLERLVDSWSAEIEVVADAKVTAGRLFEVHSLVSQYHRSAAFRVRRIEGGSP
ncbi:MAG: biopolymer transporter ExbD [Bacteroidetes bacterium]|nr:biopolymer transporter ExbD [Bacteroidota bacterium]